MRNVGRSRFMRRSTALGMVAAVACMVAGGALASSAAAKGYCGWNQCAWANANYGGGVVESNGYGATRADYTVLGGPYEGCTHTSFNDCASSIDSAGPYNTYYFWSTHCSGETYFNGLGTGTNFLGSYWNDQFSSDRIGYQGAC
jgi:hypothetical protein